MPDDEKTMVPIDKTVYNKNADMFDNVVTWQGVVALPIGGRADIYMTGPCPIIDADADGVADALDNCPGTALGDTVDTNGCALNASLTVPPTALPATLANNAGTVVMNIPNGSNNELTP